MLMKAHVSGVEFGATQLENDLAGVEGQENMSRVDKIEKANKKNAKLVKAPVFMGFKNIGLRN